MTGKKTRSSWMQRHLKDPWVKQAQKEGYRSRASFKLLEIDERYQLLKPGSVIVDLGAAPGGWSQVALKKTGSSGRVIALDILPMDPLSGVEVIEGDFQEDEVLEMLVKVLGDDLVDLVISDMAPNLSGIKASDQARMVYLVELTLEFADKCLKEGGGLVVKCFEGEGIDEIRRSFKSRFTKVANFKPRASRDKSRETYVIGQYYVK